MSKYSCSLEKMRSIVLDKIRLIVKEYGFISSRKCYYYDKESMFSITFEYSVTSAADILSIMHRLLSDLYSEHDGLRVSNYSKITLGGSQVLRFLPFKDGMSDKLRTHDSVHSVGSNLKDYLDISEEVAIGLSNLSSLNIKGLCTFLEESYTEAQKELLLLDQVLGSIAYYDKSIVDLDIVLGFKEGVKGLCFKGCADYYNLEESAVIEGGVSGNKLILKIYIDKMLDSLEEIGLFDRVDEERSDTYLIVVDDDIVIDMIGDKIVSARQKYPIVLTYRADLSLYNKNEFVDTIYVTRDEEHEIIYSCKGKNILF